MRSFTRTFTQITINGKTYTSVEEMPPDVRKQYEDAIAKLNTDANNNGIPDFAEQPGKGFVSYTQHNVELTDDRLPPLMQQHVRDIVNQVPIDRGGITIRLNWLAFTVLSVLIAAAIAFVWSRLNP